MSKTTNPNDYSMTLTQAGQLMSNTSNVIAQQPSDKLSSFPVHTEKSDNANSSVYPLGMCSSQAYPATVYQMGFLNSPLDTSLYRIPGYIQGSFYTSGQENTGLQITRKSASPNLSPSNAQDKIWPTTTSHSTSKEWNVLNLKSVFSDSSQMEKSVSLPHVESLVCRDNEKLYDPNEPMDLTTSHTKNIPERTLDNTLSSALRSPSSNNQWTVPRAASAEIANLGSYNSDLSPVENIGKDINQLRSSSVEHSSSSTVVLNNNSSPPVVLNKASLPPKNHVTTENSLFTSSQRLQLPSTLRSIEESARSIPSSENVTNFNTPYQSRCSDEGRCVCGICHKMFSKQSQLRLHVNIHYFERPFRCDSCAISFRTRGHLQKHKRSESHFNKLNMNMVFGAPTADNPRPFKCPDCKIAFRIHGHLAKHLRSKMHIMKLECLGKLPFGTYAEIERTGVNLNEIDTSDCDNSLESLQSMAQRLRDADGIGNETGAKQYQLGFNPESLTSDTAYSSDLTHVIAENNSESIVVQRIGEFERNLKVSNDHVTVEVKQEPLDMIDLVHPPQEHLETFNECQPETELELDSGGDSCSDDDTEDQLSETDGGPTNRGCCVCGKLCKNFQYLQHHMKKHHSEGLHYKCPQSGCKREFLNEKSLKYHLGSHNVNKLNCGQRKPQILKTLTYVQESSEEHNYNCELCGKYFNTRNSLKQHLLSHSMPRPFICEHCDAGFTQERFLKFHLQTHTQVT